jgi:molecular chaperone Hsp33
MNLTSDFIQRGLSDSTGLRFILVDVSRTSATLVRRHLAGPAACEVLSQALASVALLSSDLDNEEECVSIQWKTNGPIEGILVEAAFGGRLRGYTYRKTLADFDASPTIDLHAVLGTGGEMAVLQSVPGNLVYSGRVPATPPDIPRNLARYYNQSRQTPSGVEMVVLRDGAEIRRSAGLVAQKMPDGDTDAFVRVLEAFADDRVRRALASPVDLAALAAVLGIEDLIVVGEGDLAFECRCSNNKIMRVLTALPEEDLVEMVEESTPQTVTCNFCGEVYIIASSELREILEGRGL